jgi:hypothetical protein
MVLSFPSSATATTRREDQNANRSFALKKLTEEKQVMKLNHDSKRDVTTPQQARSTHGGCYAKKVVVRSTSQ